MSKTKLALLMAGIMILVTFSALSVNATHSHINPLSSYYIQGHVLDKNTGEPIRRALIIESYKEYNRQGIKVLRIHFLTTDSNGYFIDPDAPHNVVKLMVLKVGYHSASQTVVTFDGGAEVWFYLKPRWWI
jgi:hypothetical protein